jgi:small nuclear ribonucleoprotein (snRNP)-like protein
MAAAIQSVVLATLREAVGQRVTVECEDRREFSGVLDDVDVVSMNVRFRGKVTIRNADGSPDFAVGVVVPGRTVKLFVLPSAMRNASFFAAAASGGASAVLSRNKKSAKKEPLNKSTPAAKKVV